MQSLWGRYRDYYEKIQVPADNKRGFKTEYHYKGEWYVWDISAEALKREKIIIVCAEASRTASISDRYSGLYFCSQL